MQHTAAYNVGDRVRVRVFQQQAEWVTHQGREGVVVGVFGGITYAVQVQDDQRFYFDLDLEPVYERAPAHAGYAGTYDAWQGSAASVRR